MILMSPTPLSNHRLTVPFLLRGRELWEADEIQLLGVQRDLELQVGLMRAFSSARGVRRGRLTPASRVEVDKYCKKHVDAYRIRDPAGESKRRV